MKSLNSFDTKNEIIINKTKYSYFDLNILAKKFNFNLFSIPNTIKILLENLIRNEDGESVTKDMISSFCANLVQKRESFEVAFFPTRVLMQDFTGVPAVADLAAMRHALKVKNIDPKKILKKLTYQHPLFTVEGAKLQKEKHLISGKNNTFYCGAYWGNGFHEDGVVSALDVCKFFGKAL